MQKRILLLAQNSSQTQRIKISLQRYGLTIEVANISNIDPTSVRDILPVAILIDIDNVPSINGYHLCHAFKTNPVTSHIPIILLTHQDETSGAQQAFQAGAYDYLPKDAFVEHNLVESLRYLKLL